MLPTPYHYKIHDFIWKSIFEFRTDLISERSSAPYFIKSELTPIKILKIIDDIIDSYDDDYNEWWITTIEHQPSSHSIFAECLDSTDILNSTFDIYVLSLTDIKQFISNFENKLQTLVHYLLVEQEIDKITWKTIRYVLQYYIKDASDFMSKTNELNMSPMELNNKLSLGLSVSEINDEETFIIDSILHKRYIDGDIFNIYDGCFYAAFRGGINMVYAEGIGPSQWWVEYIIQAMPEDSQTMPNPNIEAISDIESSSDIEWDTSDEELAEAIIQSNHAMVINTPIKNSIRKIYSIVDDELKNTISEGDYLELSNILKAIYDKST